VIDWRSFNIQPSETTRFNQPNASAVMLNRVSSSKPSQILGTLDANGNIILINPNGVFFGPTSKTDVNGLIATTADLTNQNFMQGNMNFSTPGNPNAQVVSEGTITAGQAGLVGLVAPTVINSGTINAKLGHVNLSSGDTFTLDTYGDGLITLGVSDAVKQQLIKNSGTINAAGGTIQLTAGAGRKVVSSLISVPGRLDAPTATMQNGEIDITNAAPSGQVQVGGTLNATGARARQTGGTINVTGNQVTLSAGARIDASGSAGGGSVNIGGNLHGQGPLIHAQTTLVNTGALVRANALTQGDGGNIVVWSNQQTTVNGQIDAQGGPNGGDGGFVETSSHGVLNVEHARRCLSPKR
jgi:filamentous hemagglutinin family protein